MNRGIFRSELECVLTEAEAKTYSGELARLTQTQAELEDRKKEITSDYKSRIDACISQTRVIARKVSTGKEMRDVEVRWEFDFPANVKYLIRLDTYHTIDSKALTDNELQMCLDLEEAANAEEVEETPINVVVPGPDGVLPAGANESDYQPEDDGTEGNLPDMEEAGEPEIIDPPETDSFECKSCVTKKKAKKCGADCRQV